MKIKKLFITTGTSLIMMGSVLSPIIKQTSYIQEKNKISKNVNIIIITKKKIEDFIDSVHKTIFYKGEVEYGYISDNKTLSAGIEGISFVYGISTSLYIHPSKYINNYTLLRNLNNTNYFFVKIINVDPQYVLEDISKIIFPIGEIQHLTEKTKNTYHYKSPGAANRTFYIGLSVETTMDLWGTIKYYDGKDKTQISYAGTIIYDFLVSTEPDPVYWKYAYKVFVSLDVSNDYYSFQDLFKMKSKHTWLNYDYKNFYEMLKFKNNYGIPMNIQLKVDYKFLAHNLYGVSYS